ncbi:hypothetical protein [Paracidovorax citrulli]|uniref:Lipoprotein n=1 Tax=Paracidovorax citrulli TaxID=80869 RepID=A0ABY9AK85_PARCI|nr:hypothetical protein [Paracidovorax citrulli]MVT30155.1 hypothetical protein [Paracidovorax citrulli]MVT38583.1 hypothetical protein [Paracidovorax citrulli]PVY66509.1 hypothetical protein C8E08_3917 [Paracidovorax citrulli]QCX12184.1 hypothetical protein APS58_3426 [Paracidovorax citrulli]REG69321.1 hypothetical protein C8E07_2469 [Paracidovorax citrulli]
MNEKTIATLLLPAASVACILDKAPDVANDTAARAVYHLSQPSRPWPANS